MPVPPLRTSGSISRRQAAHSSSLAHPAIEPAGSSRQAAYKPCQRPQPSARLHALNNAPSASERLLHVNFDQFVEPIREPRLQRAASYTCPRKPPQSLAIQVININIVRNKTNSQ